MAGFADLAKKAAAAEKAKKNGGDSVPDGGDKGPSPTAAAATATTPPSSPKPTNNKLKNLSPFRRSPKPTKSSIAVTEANPTTVTNNSADDNWMKATAALKVMAVAEKNRRAKEGNKIADRKLVSAVSCEFWSPPPTTSLKGKVAPKALTKYQNRRRLSIEIHRVTPVNDDDDEDDEDDDDGDGGGKGKKKTSPSFLSSLMGSGSTSRKKTTKKIHSYEECVCRYVRFL